MQATRPLQCGQASQHSTSKRSVKGLSGDVGISSGIPAELQKRQFCHYRQQQRKKRAAGYNGSEGKSTEEEWIPKYVREKQTSRNENEEPKTTPAVEDPAIMKIAKEKFWGRIAVIALGAVLLSERLSGKGIVTALNLATGVPVWEIEPALGLVVGALLAAGIYPVIRQVGTRAEQGRSLFTEPDRGWGDSFQVATGRLAFLCLAATVLAEATTGKGILALLNVETGVEITEIEAGLTFLLLLLFTEDMKSSK